MKKQILFWCIISFLFTSLLAEEYQVRIGFIGNSITIGTGLDNPEEECYPSQLAALLQNKYGDTCLVENFAVSGRTMLKKGDYPIWDEGDFESAWEYAPDICFIMLGTNDTKPQNWDDYGNEFLDDYISMIDTFMVRNPLTKFVVCYPPPAFDVVWGIRDSIILNGVIPVVDSVKKYADALLIDFYNPLLTSENLFPDKIHPNATGAGQMAQIIFNRFTESGIIDSVDTGFARITDVRSNKSIIPRKDSITLFWSSFNADTVLLNNTIIPEEGSIIVYPNESMWYKFIAKGQINTDTLKHYIEVYEPVFTDIQLFPTKIKMETGETKTIAITYKDHLGNKMIDTAFAVNWTLSSSLGNLIDETNETISYYATNAGTDTITCSFGNISTIAVVTITGTSGIINNRSKDELRLSYNEDEKIIEITSSYASSSGLEVSLYNINGTKILNAYINDTSHSIHIDDNILPGIYFYRVKTEGSTHSGKILIW